MIKIQNKSLSTVFHSHADAFSFGSLKLFWLTNVGQFITITNYSGPYILILIQVHMIH